MEFNIEAIKSVYDNSPFAFAVVHVAAAGADAPKKFVFAYENAALIALSGHSVEELRGKDLCSLLNAAGRKWLQLCGEVAFRGGTDTCTEYRPETQKYLRAQIYQLAPGYCGCTIFDITEEQTAKEDLKKHTDSIFDLNRQLSLYRSSNIGGAHTVRLDEPLTLVYGNDLYFNIHECTREEMLGKSCARFIHPQDLPRVRALLADAKKNHRKTAQWEMRILTAKKNLKYLLVSGSFEEGAESLFNGCVTDISRAKETEHALRASEEKFRIATENSDISFWTYVYDRKVILQTASSQARHGFEQVVENVPESLIQNGHIRQDSAVAFAEMYHRLENGAKTASGDFWTYNAQKKIWWCEHIDYTNMFDEYGHPTHAYAVGRDVTAAKVAEKKYRDETAYAAATQSENLLAKVRSNITRNITESYLAKATVSISANDLPYTETADRLAQTAFTEKERALLSVRLGRNHLLQIFSEGETSNSIDYRRRLPDGSVIWVNTTVKLFQNPDSGDIMSFMYTYNINEDRVKDGLINTVTSLEYDYIAYIDLKDETFKLYHGAENYDQLLPTTATNYTQSVYDVNRTVVTPEDAARAVADMLPEGIRKNLKDRRVFSTVYSIFDENKNVRQKRIQYAYLDEVSEQVICTRTDVTDLLLQQKQQQSMLETALLAAQQASSAKSDFLSRMSHEIRTPMNAIIGMSAIAAQSIGDDVQVADCISKISISSRFLLSLINDILDMSRIESGKMLLKNEKIPFEDFLTGINSICYTQAAAKEIDYENIVDPEVEDFYLGDAMKLQQVVINILANAIKFTPAHGKVSLKVQQLRKTKNQATIRFVVNDSGCGIAEEFIPHLFDPFSQEHSGTTSMYGGTGLGLAICKNLVDMMDGQIQVRSIVGAGSEFIVDVKLGITAESRTRYLHKPHYNFTQLKALVVDDDVTVCEHAIITMKEIGVTAEWVDSGKKAIARVREKWQSNAHYDLVLVDWKMPEMDGIETARQIRKIVGPEVTIIIMTAYEWASIEHDAKLAGVNLLMSKPMFKSTLISTFEKALGHQQEVATKITDEFRFDGKRVLLAEDHPLNVEVARRLLERRGFAVEVAENGLRALEMYTTTPVGYYDAILMDIRMPQMDGLQAANAIRHLTKKTAKTIPIIAMTANAFDDDIQKSKAAGMNAHLAKPIDPRQMYQTLYDFIYCSHIPKSRK